MTVDLQQKITELDKSEKRISELIQQQKKILLDLWNDKKEIASIVKENGYTFSHPSIEYRSTRGPVLGYSKKDNDLFVFELGQGLIKVNLYTNESRNTSWIVMIELGLFVEAYEGIKYLDRMIDDYINQNQDTIRSMVEQISKI